VLAYSVLKRIFPAVVKQSDDCCLDRFDSRILMIGGVDFDDGIDSACRASSPEHLARVLATIAV
jgi:hypothetical protein